MKSSPHTINADFDPVHFDPELDLLRPLLGGVTVEMWAAVRKSKESAAKLASITRLFGVAATKQWIIDRYSGVLTSLNLRKGLQTLV
jgi:hypothetical protein